MNSSKLYSVLLRAEDLVLDIHGLPQRLTVYVCSGMSSFLIGVFSVLGVAQANLRLPVNLL